LEALGRKHLEIAFLVEAVRLQGIQLAVIGYGEQGILCGGDCHHVRDEKNE
jgi:hypothetical protein